MSSDHMGPEVVKTDAEFPAARSERTPLQLLGPGNDGFDEFYRVEYRPLLRLAWSLTGRRDLGEELVQEVMVRCHQRWRRLARYDRPGGFARRILLNEATSAARRRDTERRATERMAVEEARLRTEPEPEPPDPEFWAALRSLPDRQCQAVALHYLEDRPIAEIAEILDIAENTVKVHLHRGRSALARTLRPEPTARAADARTEEIDR